MHAEAVKIDIDEVLRTEPIQPQVFTAKIMWLFVALAFVIFTVGLFMDPAHTWAVFYVNSFYFFSLALGGIMLPVMFQIVRATWSAPIRRIAEANAAFLPYAYFLFLFSYFGKEYLFPWARGPLPGREAWMQPDLVYARFAILLGILVYLMMRFVKLSLRGDIGLAKEKMGGQSCWKGYPYDGLTAEWTGSQREIPMLQNKMSWNAPLIVFVYAIVVSLVSFEMVMGMDTTWISNLFGGFIFLGNIYMGFAATSILTIYFASKSPAYNRCVSTQQLWDLGKLTFAFCMLWGYTFFGQYLVQWYGNLPEETQWLFHRSKEMPWQPLGWLTFFMCFVTPFILLCGEDIKKTPPALATVCSVVLGGVWLERYVEIMPEVFPDRIPFGIMEIALFLGFLGIYFLCVTDFMRKFPYVPVSHPQTRGITKW